MNLHVSQADANDALLYQYQSDTEITENNFEESKYNPVKS